MLRRENPALMVTVLTNRREQTKTTPKQTLKHKLLMENYFDVPEISGVKNPVRKLYGILSVDPREPFVPAKGVIKTVPAPRVSACLRACLKTVSENRVRCAEFQTTFNSLIYSTVARISDDDTPAAQSQR